MHAEDLVVDDDGEREEVEHVREVRPHMRRAILAHALRVEAVRLSSGIIHRIALSFVVRPFCLFNSFFPSFHEL